MSVVESPIPGTRMEVEQMGYRNWCCYLRNDETNKPVWGMFGIRTSSERVARERCREFIDKHFVANEGEAE